MDLKPHVSKLLSKELYTLVTITFFVVLAFAIIQVLVVTFDSEVTHAKFVKYVWSWVAGSLFILWLFTPGLRYLWFINLQYSIEDERLVIQKGILTKKNISIPYSAVTDFTLNRSLYDRWLNIGSLFVQTAGQGAQAAIHEGRLDGLVEFESLFITLRGKVKAYRGDMLGETVATPEATAGDSEVLLSILDEIKKIGRKLE